MRNKMRLHNKGALFFMTSIIILSLLFCVESLYAQRRTTEEYMQSLGFNRLNNDTWINEDKVSVKIDNDKIKAFEAPQTHSWSMVFGDGQTLGTSLNISIGDTIRFSDGKLYFPSGAVMRFLSSDQDVFISRGLLKSAIFNKARDVLNVTDIRIINSHSDGIGLISLSGLETDEQALDKYGNLVEKVKATQAVEGARRQKINSDFENNKIRLTVNLYEEYCNKYGKDKIDRALSGEFVVGVPWDIVHYYIINAGILICKVQSETLSSITYRVEEIMKTKKAWNYYYIIRVDNKKGIISSVNKYKYYKY